MQDINERNDEVYFEQLNIISQSNIIRDFFRKKGNNLNSNRKSFFSGAQKVNYVDDIYHVPYLRNPFTTEKSFSCGNFNYLIDKHTQIYLNSMKVKYQKEKDLVSKKNNKKLVQEIKPRLANKDQILFDNVSHYDIEDFFIYKYERFDDVGFCNKKTRASIKAIDLDKDKQREELHDVENEGLICS